MSIHAQREQNLRILKDRVERELERFLLLASRIIGIRGLFLFGHRPDIISGLRFS